MHISQQIVQQFPKFFLASFLSIFLTDTQPRPNVKSRLAMLLAMLPARLPEYSALPARFDAWLNLSHREKARVLVMVRMRAIAARSLACHIQTYTNTPLSLPSLKSRMENDIPQNHQAGTREEQ